MLGYVVGERGFACAVHSDASDYRYAASQGATTEISEFDISDTAGQRVVALVRGLGLRLAGVDFRVTPEGNWVCFEVNPSPGFPYYEGATNHNIAAAIANELLAR